MRLNRISLISIFMVLLFALAACGGTPTNAPPDNGGDANATDANTNAPVDNADAGDDNGDAGTGEIVMSSLAGSARLDPAVASSSDTAVLEASSYIYDTVFSGAAGEGLALEWSVSDDGLTYEVRLRANAVFSDGTPVTSDAVIANFYRWFDPENDLHGDSDAYEAWLAYFGGFREAVPLDGEPSSLFDGVEKVDQLNFLIHVFEPMDNLIDILSMPQFSILNPDILEATGDQYGLQGSPIVGSGQYVVQTWDADGLVLSPSASYWGMAGSGTVVFPAP
jgi:ABC-type transport system substrate-binding protein